MIKFICYSKCTTCQKAKKWFDNNKIEYEFRDTATAQTIFMGSIPKYSSFDEVCDIFHKLGGVSLRQEGHKVIITAN